MENAIRPGPTWSARAEVMVMSMKLIITVLESWVSKSSEVSLDVAETCT